MVHRIVLCSSKASGSNGSCAAPSIAAEALLCRMRSKLRVDTHFGCSIHSSIAHLAPRTYAFCSIQDRIL